MSPHIKLWHACLFHSIQKLLVAAVGVSYCYIHVLLLVSALTLTWGVLFFSADNFVSTIPVKHTTDTLSEVWTCVQSQLFVLPSFLSLPFSVRTALIAIIGFMPTKGEGAIGSLDYTPEERRALAKKYDSPSPTNSVAIHALEDV